MQSVKKTWNLYSVVQGRATRMEFWGFAVFVEGLTLLFSLPLWLYSSFVQADDFFVSGAFSPRLPLYLEIFHQLVSLHAPVLLLCLPLGVPMAAVLARRLHDVGVSACWALLPLVAGMVCVLSGLVVLFLMFCVRTEAEYAACGAVAVPLRRVCEFSMCGIILSFLALGILLAWKGEPGPNRYGKAP